MRRRLGRVALGASGGLLYIAVVTGGEQGTVSPLFGVLAASGLTWLVWTVVQRRRPMVADGWAPAVALSYAPAVPRPVASGPGVARALAAVETRELVTSPAFGLGLGLSALILYTFGYEWGGDYGGDLLAAVEMSPLLLHPLAGMVVLTAFRARTRGRRDATEELFASCPTPNSRRTAGHLLTGVVPAALGTAIAAALLAFIAFGDATPYGEVGARQVAAVLGAGLLCLGAVGLGIALARWLPWTLVPIVAVIAIGFAAGRLATQGTRTTEPMRQLSTLLVDPEVDIRLTAPHWLAHHLWILALVVLVGVIGLLRDDRRPAVLAAGGSAIALAVVSGVLATRPIDAADATRIATLLDPASLTCDDVEGFDVCTFPGDDAARTELAAPVRIVAAAVPAGALAGHAIRPTTDLRWKELDPEVLRILRPTPQDDPILIQSEFSTHPWNLEAVQIWAGLAATGVLQDRAPGTTHVVRGQARGVIALWLGTLGHDDDTQRKLTSNGVVGSGHDEIRPWPDSCYAGSPPVQWAETDVVAASRMLTLPTAEVVATLAAEWAHLTDRATTTDALMARLGLPAVGLDGVTASAAEC